MPLVDTLPVGSDTAQWSVWSTVARVVVARPDRIGAARELVEAELAAVDRTASRFRADSELMRLAAGVQRVSPLLAELVAAALAAARETDGDVDPTVGSLMRRLGYDRDIAALTVAPAVGATAAPGWRRLGLDGDMLTLPEGVELDLGATA